MNEIVRTDIDVEFSGTFVTKDLIDVYKAFNIKLNVYHGAVQDLRSPPTYTDDDIIEEIGERIKKALKEKVTSDMPTVVFLDNEVSPGIMP